MQKNKIHSKNPTKSMNNLTNDESIESLINNLCRMFVKSYNNTPNLLITGMEGYRKLFHILKTKVGNKTIIFDENGGLENYLGMTVLINHKMGFKYKVMFGIG